MAAYGWIPSVCSENAARFMGGILQGSLFGILNVCACACACASRMVVIIGGILIRYFCLPHTRQFRSCQCFGFNKFDLCCYNVTLLRRCCILCLFNINTLHWSKSRFVSVFDEAGHVLCLGFFSWRNSLCFLCLIQNKIKANRSSVVFSNTPFLSSFARNTIEYGLRCLFV